MTEPIPRVRDHDIRWTQSRNGGTGHVALTWASLIWVALWLEDMKRETD